MRSAVDVIHCDFCQCRVEVESSVMPPHWQRVMVMGLPDGVPVMMDACARCAAPIKRLMGDGGGQLSLQFLKETGVK